MKKQQKQINNEIDVNETLQPQSLETEKIVLGSIILESNIVDKIMSDFNENLFYSNAHQKIAKAIINLYRKHEPIDLITIIHQLKSENDLEKVGGAYYITNLTNNIASSVNIDFHIKILQQESLRRNLIKISSKSIQKAFDLSEDVFDTFQEAQIDLDNSLKSILHYEIKQVGQVHKEIIAESIEIMKKGERSGVPSGLRMVDNVTNGWQKSDLIILAGRPGMGKTAAAVCMAMNPAINKQIPVAIFSLEMSSQQLVSRMQSNLSTINVSKIVKKQLNEDEIKYLGTDCAYLENAPMYIDDTPNISLLELKGKCRKLVKENKVQLIIIDYLQLMRSGLNIMNREQEIAEISRGLKSLAKELSIPVIALSQLSRTVEGRGDKKPMLSDLRESGQIEQDADMVMFCYRPEYYGIESYEVGNQSFDSRGLFMLILAKHRNGELGEIPLTFIHEQTKIVNYGQTQVNNNGENTTNNNSSIEENKNFLNENPF